MYHAYSEHELRRITILTWLMGRVRVLNAGLTGEAATYVWITSSIRMMGLHEQPLPLSLHSHEHGM